MTTVKQYTTAFSQYSQSISNTPKDNNRKKAAKSSLSKAGLLTKGGKARKRIVTQ